VASADDPSDTIEGTCPSRKPEPFEMLDIDSSRDHP
jgi:hypothetical protein